MLDVCHMSPLLLNGCLLVDQAKLILSAKEKRISMVFLLPTHSDT